MNSMIMNEHESKSELAIISLCYLTDTTMGKPERVRI